MKTKILASLRLRRKTSHLFGIDLGYSKPGEIRISMIDYIKEMIQAFPDQKELDKKVNTPVAVHLFQTKETNKLSQ